MTINRERNTTRTRERKRQTLMTRNIMAIHRNKTIQRNQTKKNIKRERTRTLTRQRQRTHTHTNEKGTGKNTNIITEHNWET